MFKRIVDYGDGWMPNRVTPEQVAQGRAAIDELAEAAGRDPESISVSVYGQPADRELIAQLQEAGADRVMVRLETAPEEESIASISSSSCLSFASC